MLCFILTLRFKFYIISSYIIISYYSGYIAMSPLPPPPFFLLGACAVVFCFILPISSSAVKQTTFGFECLNCHRKPNMLSAIILLPTSAAWLKEKKKKQRKKNTPLRAKHAKQEGRCDSLTSSKAQRGWSSKVRACLCIRTSLSVTCLVRLCLGALISPTRST